MRARALGHPVHPMLIVFPVGLLVTAVVLDVVDVLGGPGYLGDVAYWNIVCGLIGAVLAAATGWLDWTGIPPATRAKRLGLYHGLTNGGIVLMFAAVWLVRLVRDGRATTWPLLVVEVLALLLLGVSGWMGGELVDRLGIGVDEGAHADAPSSLSGRPTAERVVRAP